MIAIPITSDPVPKSFCAITDSDWQFLRGLLHASLAGDPTINYGPAKPTPDKRNLPWYRLNTDGSPDRWYVFNAGQWISPHALPVDFIGIYAGDPSLIPTFDGGNANPVSVYDGPFWQRLPGADGRFLVQSGITPAPDSTTLKAGVTGGEEKHELLLPEMPSHAHPLIADVFTNPVATLTPANFVAKGSNYDGAGSPDSYILSGTPTTPTLGLTGNAGGNGATPPATTRHNNMPPFLCVTFIQRTARRYFSIPA